MGIDARLQLANPSVGQSRIALQMSLEAILVDLRVVERVEVRGQSTEQPDEPELRGNDVADQAKLHSLHEFEAILSLPLDLNERISRRQKVRD
jgi:hypothetical protein